MRYILFVKEECPYCSLAEDLLEENQLRYDSVHFSPEQTAILEEMKKVYEWSTVPMIFRRENNQIEFIGGYTDLKVFLESDGKRK